MANINDNDKFYVVGIGASAGGLQSIQELFDNIPADTGLCFVIVQHLSPNFKSLMNELLSKHTEMKIKLAENNILLEPNHIYLNPRDKNLKIKNGRIVLIEKEKKTRTKFTDRRFFPFTW